MNCPDSSNKIGKVISGLPGVTKARVDFVGETLSAEVSAAQAAGATATSWF